VGTLYLLLKLIYFPLHESVSYLASQRSFQDGLTSEQMLAYVERVLNLAQSWTVHSTALLQRSWLEFERRKTADRAMLQVGYTE